LLSSADALTIMTTAIQLDRVSKKFKLNTARPRSFFEMVVQRNVREPAQEVWVLRDVSLTIGRGEVVGLIGPNGTGKSTILKLINRIIEPSSGRVKTAGRVASLLELGAGFHPDLTGRENILLNAAVLGIPRHVVKSQMDAIIDFAEIGSFIDVPVRNYSSGMAMRLGFAITTTLESDILLIDEILAVGDRAIGGVACAWHHSLAGLSQSGSSSALVFARDLAQSGGDMRRW
jgi:ABC-type polysaccharide/polyol phosphate transport system ATPase subunit